MKPLILSALLISGCAHTWNPVDYGIQPNGQYSALRSINELPESEIWKKCGTGKAGCVCTDESCTHFTPPAVLDVYYREGDECALRHELHHVMQGGQHTVKYHQHLIQGKGRICPI